MSQINDIAKAVLLQRRSAIQHVFQNNIQKINQLAGDVESDMLDRANNLETSTMLSRLSDDERTELTEIDAALTRISAGTYGRCEKCEQAIGRQRLRAIPEARFCIACLETAERANL